MLNWFRNRARHIGASVLVAFSLLGAGSAHPHDDDCHDTCVALASHDASAHRFQGAPEPESPAQPLHCTVCHWARSFRPNVAAAFVPAPAAERRASVPTLVTAAARPPLAAQPPLRSPPLDLA